MGGNGGRSGAKFGFHGVLSLRGSTGNSKRTANSCPYVHCTRVLLVCTRTRARAANCSTTARTTLGRLHSHYNVPSMPSNLDGRRNLGLVRGRHHVRLTNRNFHNSSVAHCDSSC